jgi:hypothetical protein
VSKEIYSRKGVVVEIHSLQPKQYIQPKNNIEKRWELIL